MPVWNPYTKGDVIEVARYVIDGFRISEDWQPAVVVYADGWRMEVKALRGTLDKFGHEYMWVQVRDYGTQWR